MHYAYYVTLIEKDTTLKFSPLSCLLITTQVVPRILTCAEYIGKLFVDFGCLILKITKWAIIGKIKT